MARVLVAARLSRSDGGPSRIERDDERSRAWAEANGHEVVATSEDPGVSGSVSPFDRKGLGPWLDTGGSLIHDYDMLVASSIDRLGRSFRDMCTLRDWCDDNGKAITVLDPPLHWPPSDSDIATPILWDLLARFAETELKTITKRHADARAKVRENRGFVGKPPFGFVVTGEKYSRTIQPIPELVPIIHELVTRAVRGDTRLAMAHWLDTQVPCRQQGKAHKGVVVNGWSPVSVKNVLTNTALIGEQRDSDGKVLHRHEPIVTPDEWRELQTALQRNAKRSGRKRGGSDIALLTGIIRCELCSGRMFSFKSTTTRKDGSKHTIRYYRCKGADNAPSRCKNMIRCDRADKTVEFHFRRTTAGNISVDTPYGKEINRSRKTGIVGPISVVTAYGNLEIIERLVMPGDDHLSEIAEVEDRLRALDYDDSQFSSKQSQLLSERRKLQGLPVSPSKIVERPTGRRVADVWDSLDQSARRRYLLATGVKLMVHPIKGAHMTGDPSKIVATLRTIEAT